MYNEPVFYLKINRGTDFALECFWHWTKIAQAGNSSIVVVCDDSELSELIGRRFIEEGYGSFLEIIPSDSCTVLPLISGIIEDPRWVRTASALLTPYLHASTHGVSSLWNIDADDTYMYASPRNCSVLLKRVSDEVLEKDYLAASLDMHYSFMQSRRKDNWTFGVTYSAYLPDVKQILEDAKPLVSRWKEEGLWNARNIDELFANMDRYGRMRLLTFGAPGLCFKHSHSAVQSWTSDHIRIQNLSYERLLAYRLSFKNFRNASVRIPKNVALFEMPVSEVATCPNRRSKITFIGPNSIGLNLLPRELVYMFAKIHNSLHYTRTSLRLIHRRMRSGM